jgi:hypothetical protein
MTQKRYTHYKDIFFIHIKSIFADIQNIVRRKSRLLLLAFSFVSMLGCRSGMKIDEVTMGVPDIRRTIAEVLGEPRRMAEGGREFISRYHDQHLGVLLNSDKSSSRYYTVVDIIGESRPYTLYVETFRETKDEEGVFELDEKDRELAQKIADEIEKRINLLLKNKNLIDDFKPF